MEILFSRRLKRNIQQALPFWIAALLVGLVAVGYTSLFNLAEGLLHSVMSWDKRMIFLLAPICFILAWWMVVRFAPFARGSGIPQVMAALDLSTSKEQAKIGKLLSIRVMLTKISSSLLMVFGGGAIGREGPTIQIAASVFMVVNKWIPKTWPQLSGQSFILTGASAGLAAAFNTPLGGIVFAMEELAKIHIRFFRTALFSGVLIAGLTAQGILGPYLYLGYPDVRGLQFSIFFYVGATAIVAGIFGAVMCRGIIALMNWKNLFSGWRLIVFIFFSALTIACLAFFVNADIIGSGRELMNTYLFSNEKSAGPDTVIMRILGPIIAFNSGGAGGVFAPSLSAGASIGALCADIFQMKGAESNIIVLSGMVGFLTGVTRTPFTSAILVLEMTDRHSVIFHLILAALISNLVALVIDRRSLYDRLKRNYIEEVNVKQN